MIVLGPRSDPLSHRPAHHGWAMLLDPFVIEAWDNVCAGRLLVPHYTLLHKPTQTLIWATRLRMGGAPFWNLYRGPGRNHTQWLGFVIPDQQQPLLMALNSLFGPAATLARQNYLRSGLTMLLNTIGLNGLMQGPWSWYLQQRIACNPAGQRVVMPDSVPVCGWIFPTLDRIGSSIDRIVLECPTTAHAACQWIPWLDAQGIVLARPNRALPDPNSPLNQ